MNSADFHNAVEAGVDEKAHIPLLDMSPMAVEDATVAARGGIVVITTRGAVLTLTPMILRKDDLPQIQARRSQKSAVSE